MKQKNKNFIPTFITLAAIFNVIAVTPFFNKDGMIIPKLIIMLSTSMYLLPIILANLQIVLRNKLLKFIILIQILILIQCIIVMILSAAPLTQQIFGRTGRGLGLISIFSLILIFIAASMFIPVDKLRTILLGFIISAALTSLYSLLQSFGIDLIAWESRTNGVIGTLGNPNYQSAFAAMALIPSVLYFLAIDRKLYLALFSFVFFVFVIYRTQSTQGIIGGLASIIIVLLIYFWYKNKLIFISTLFIGLAGSILAVIGMLSFGPFSPYLYKVSIQSRGDFWRSAFATANDHPFFGVGLDSFGDYSLKYRDARAAGHPWAEYTDNAHNFFLQQASTGGYIYAVLNLALTVTVFYSFIKIQKSINKFDPVVVSLFSAWSVFQLTSVISPESLATLFWNSIISGAAVSFAKNLSKISNISTNFNSEKFKSRPYVSIISGMLGFLMLIPLFNTDRKQLVGMKTGDANLVMEATLSFPESTVRYNLIGRELYDSGLSLQALEIARAGVKFNPNSPALWALILVNQDAAITERFEAKKRILELDPLNKNVANYDPSVQ